jgi:hypothetical protein
LFILLLLLAVIAVEKLDACIVKNRVEKVVVVFQPDAVATIESNQIKEKGPNRGLRDGVKAAGQGL